MPHLLAGRFVALGTQWIDLATGAPVRLRVIAAGSRGQQAVWTEGCDTLARLRHPLLNPLVDYGALDSTRLFEAYATQAPITATPAGAGRLLRHAARFLDLQGIHLTRPVAECAMRAVSEARTPRSDGEGVFEGRPVGIILQPRRVLDHVDEALDAQRAGPVTVTVTGGTGCGLTTLRVLTARIARLNGYAPVCGAAIACWPWIGDAILERHVCILADADAPARERAAVARLLARVGTASARGHLAITFRRSEEQPAHALAAEPLGVTAMTAMLFLDDDCHGRELFEAARAADGRPGIFLRRLNAAPFEAPAARPLVVHESAPAYVVASVAQAPPQELSRTRSARVARGACARAARLVGRGRHAAAARVLTRAFQVLHGRGDAGAAAQAAIDLGWLLRERGDTTAALRQFERARTVHTHERTAVAAAIGAATCWTDEARLTEAEAAARAAVAAAAAAGDGRLADAAALALARTLSWALRLDEATVLVEPVAGRTDSGVSAEAKAAWSRLLLARGDATAAMGAARDALRAAETEDRPRAVAVAHCAAAAASMAIGDLVAVTSHVERGLAAAHQARAPLLAFRLRALQALALNRHEPGDALSVRCRETLRRAASRQLPALLRWRLLIACGTAPAAELERFVRDTGARALLEQPALVDPKFTHLQRFIELCHSAPDDRAALERLCEDLRIRLHATTVAVVGKGPERRQLAIAGRRWLGEPRAAFNAVDAAIPIANFTGAAPAQAAEPVKFGGEAIAALCSRWTAGALVDATYAGVLLRLASLAIGPVVRSLLDRTPSAGQEHVCPELLGTSAAAAGLRSAIARAARAPFPVLIQGDSGTGKELVARAIHRLGPRRDRRFCAINCAAITEELLEAELFGHARGAFTGAVTERAGVFEEADGGTLFLDEVGELSARAQAKLLRVLQEGEVRRVGENFPRRVDARVIAATNRRLADEVDAGRFRADLRYRLDVVRIDVPPLRERPDDIPLLAERFWTDATARVGSTASLAPDAVGALARYDWPGNVRELQNVLASMSLHAPRRGRVTASLIPPHVANAYPPSATTFDLAREEFERRFIRAALAQASGHPGRAARALGVSRQGLAKMMKRLRIDSAP